MFPQSELDNYKLQVELLQEKLQRSEISRQHLEHKLDKILQKRDEHDKILRSKAKQKYQQFLEEQQRRNERNKQLVLMLERIEQQTEAINARSERLKMMKLQYEMYFAKLVHSQTRRCIQNSIQPVIPNCSTQHMWPAKEQPTMEGHNYVNSVETTTPSVSNLYPFCAAGSFYENETHLRSQPENTLTKPADIPTLRNFVRKESKDFMDSGNRNCTSSPQQMYQYNAKSEPVNNQMLTFPPNLASNNKNMSENICYPKAMADMKSNPSVANLLPNDKKIPDFKENSNLSISSSSTFEEPPNVSMMSQRMQISNELPNIISTTKSYNEVIISDDIQNDCGKFDTLQNSQNTDEISSQLINQKDNASSHLQNGNIMSTVLHDERKEAKSPIVNEYKTSDIPMPKLNEKPVTSLDLETEKSVPETSSKFSNNKNVFKKQPESIEHFENETFAYKSESNSSATPVSIENIENIENEIYGELLSPLQPAETHNQDSSSVVPKLLENLVTQAENLENISSEGKQIKHDNSPGMNNAAEEAATDNNNELNQDMYNYEQTITKDEFGNVQEFEESAKNFAEYTNYDNIDPTAVDESQQQQYDYSNYDPTQYSYPGYIYDETTGEYKPDPNAPAEQYATDQQYSSEGYEQQFQQQDYDFNQTYVKDSAAALSTTTENTSKHNYDPPQQDISSNLATPEDNAKQQELITQPELIAPQTDLPAEEVPIPSTTKVVKPTSILSTADRSDSQKKKKRVNFIDSSETDESVTADKGALPTIKSATGNLAGSSESDFDFSNSTDAEVKDT